MLLMEEAERIAKEEHGSHKIGVISGELNLCMLGNFSCFCSHLLTFFQNYFSCFCCFLLTFFKINFFKKIFSRTLPECQTFLF